MEATVNPRAPIEGKNLTAIMNEKQKTKNEGGYQSSRNCNNAMCARVCVGGGICRECLLLKQHD